MEQYKSYNTSKYSKVVWAHTIVIFGKFWENLGGECRKLAPVIVVQSL